MGSRPEVACRAVLILTRAEVEALLDPVALLDAVSAGFQALSAGAFDGAAAPGGRGATAARC